MPHQLVLNYCVLSGPKSTQALTICSLYGGAEFLFQPDLAPAHSAETATKWLAYHSSTVFNWQTQLT